MKKTTVYLDEFDDLRLSRAAARRGATRTALIRDAIRSLLDVEEAAAPRPQPLGNSGRRDISATVDEILDGGFGR